MRHGRLVILLGLMLGAGRAMGEEPASPVAAAQEVARAVLAALTAEDARALAALAARDEPDPWIVCDQLLRQGEHAAAATFAATAPRPDTEALTAYVASQRETPDSAQRWQQFWNALAALRARDGAGALSVLGAAPSEAAVDTLAVEFEVVRGRALLMTGRTQDGAQALRHAAELALTLGWLSRAASMGMEACEAWLRGGPFSEAVVEGTRLVAVAQRRGVPRDVAAARSVRGRALRATGALRAAERELEVALEIAHRDGHVRSVMAITINLANVYQDLGESSRSLAVQQRALEQAESAGDLHVVGVALGNVGNALLAQGQVVKALAAFERSAEILRAQGDALGAARALHSVGTAQFALGDLSRALASLERALEVRRRGGDAGGAASSLTSLAGVQIAMGQPERAVELQRLALAQIESLGNRRLAARWRINLAAAVSEAGDPATAVADLARALAELEALEDRVGVADARMRWGSAQVLLGELAAGREALERSRQEWEALGNARGALAATVQLADAMARLGELPGARSLFERAVHTARSLRDASRLVAALQGLGELHLAAGQPSRALARYREALGELEHLFGGLGEEEGALAREYYERIYEGGAVAAARDEDAPEVLSFLESARAGALLDTLGKRDALRWKAETLPVALREAESRARAGERSARQAHEQALAGGERRAVAQSAAALDTARDETRAVHARVQREVKRAAGLFYPRACSLDELQAALAPEETLVLYGLCRKQALAVVVRVADVRIVDLGARAEVEAACEALRLGKQGAAFEEPVADLRRLLVEPLGLDPATGTLLVCPTGPLCVLPWAALWDGPVVLTPSGTTHALLRAEEGEGGTGVLALGDPDYAGASPGARAIYYRNRVLTSLPATRSEAERVGTLTLLGAQASEEGLRAALARQPRWRAVHFACHGLIDPKRPTLSSLALSRAGEDDGFLTALEVLRMQIPADLAVLSACETGTGKLVGGEGIVGLTRAFMYAGAPRVLCSLWKVDDEATAALMQAFYAAWNPKGGAPGLTAAEALRRAQEHARGQERWKHPYYWAAWVLWGLP